MRYRSLGHDKMQVSQLGFGVMRLPVIDHVYANINEEAATELIRYAIDQGINYFDTAYPYHGSGGMAKPGNSEPFLAKALSGGYREKIYLASKIPSVLIKTKEHMDYYLDLQLQRLHTAYLDYYLLHSLTAKYWQKYKQVDVFSFLDKAKADGRIKYTGFSFHGDSLALFKEIIDAYPWDICQIQYNYMDTDYSPGKEGLDYAAAKGIDVVVMEPLKGGTLANGLPPAAANVFHQANNKRSNAEWSLRWLWDHPAVKVILSGMSNIDQLEENIAIASDAKENSLSTDELAAIAQARAIIKDKIKVACTGCNYCMPCPYGVDIPKNFKFYNRLFLFDAKRAIDQEKMQYGFAIPKAKRADKCINCGKCEVLCPQRLPIAHWMGKIAEEMAQEK